MTRRGQVIAFVDATDGDFYTRNSLDAARVSVLAQIDGDFGYDEADGVFDPRCLRWHDMQRTSPSGRPDRRMSVQVVNDFEAEYEDARPGDAPYGQPEYFSALNRSTREVDTAGRVAIPSSLRRIVDTPDGRYGLALTTVGRDLGVAYSLMDQSPGSRQAREPVEFERADNRPGGMVWSPPVKGKRLGAVGDLGSVFAPHAGFLATRGREGTSHRFTMPLRHDAHFAMDLYSGDRTGARWFGPIAFVDADARRIRYPTNGRLFKGEMWPDDPRPTSDDDPNAVAKCSWVPVVRVTADLPVDPPPGSSGSTPSTDSRGSQDSEDEGEDGDPFLQDDPDRDPIPLIGTPGQPDPRGGVIVSKGEPVEDEGGKGVMQSGETGPGLQDDDEPEETGAIASPFKGALAGGQPGSSQQRDTGGEGVPCLAQPGAHTVITSGKTSTTLHTPDGKRLAIGGALVGAAVGAREGSAIASGVAGGVNVAGAAVTASTLASVDLGLLGDRGGVGSLQDYVWALGQQWREYRAALHALLARGHYAGNIAAIHTATPGNPSAPSVLGSRVVASDGQTRVVRRDGGAVEVVGILEAESGGTVKASGGPILTVVREHRGDGDIRDDRPLVLLENRGAGAKRSGGDLLRTPDRTFAVGSGSELHATEVGALTPQGSPVKGGVFAGYSDPKTGKAVGEPGFRAGPDGAQTIALASGTPETPQSGFVKVYPAADGTITKLDSDGNTTSLEAAGLSGLGASDNALVRTDGTAGTAAQGSGVTLDDSDVMTSLTGLGLTNQASEPFGGANTGLWLDNSDATARPAWAVGGSEYGIPFVDVSSINDGDVPAWNTAGNNWLPSSASLLPSSGGAYGVIQRNAGDTAWTSSTQLDLRHDPGPSGSWSNAAHFIQNTDTVAATQDLVALELANPNHNPTSVASGKGGTGLSFTGLSGTPTGGITGRRTSTLSGDLYLGGTGGGTPIYTARAWANYTSTDGFDISGDGYLTFEDILSSDPSLSSISTGLGGDRCAIYPKNGVLYGRNVGGDAFAIGAQEAGADVVTALGDDGTTAATQNLTVYEQALPTSGSAAVTISNIIRAPGRVKDIKVIVKVAIGTGGGATAVNIGDDLGDVDRFGVLSSFTINSYTDFEDWTVAADGPPLYNPAAGATDVVLNVVGGTWDSGTVVVIVEMEWVAVTTYV